MSADARLSFYDYLCSRELADRDPPFYALIAAAMRRADTRNLAALVGLYPGVYADLDARYNAPGGMLPGEGPADGAGHAPDPYDVGAAQDASDVALRRGETP